MTKKHFELIAKVLIETRSQIATPDQRVILNKLTESFVKEFKDLNPRFNTRIFLDRSGYTLSDQVFMLDPNTDPISYYIGE